MALVVEDGTGVVGANSFVSVADATTFLADRGYSITTDVEQRLLQAMDVLKYQSYRGSKTAATNALPFPRTGVVDREGAEYADDVVPTELIEAQIWAAYYADQGVSVNSPTAAAVKFEKVDVLETEYAVSEGATTRLDLSDIPGVYNAIRHLLSAYSAGGVIRA